MEFLASTGEVEIGDWRLEIGKEISRGNCDPREISFYTLHVR